MRNKVSLSHMIFHYKHLRIVEIIVAYSHTDRCHRCFYYLRIVEIIVACSPYLPPSQKPSIYEQQKLQWLVANKLPACRGLIYEQQKLQWLVAHFSLKTSNPSTNSRNYSGLQPCGMTVFWHPIYEQQKLQWLVALDDSHSPSPYLRIVEIIVACSPLASSSDVQVSTNSRNYSGLQPTQATGRARPSTNSRNYSGLQPLTACPLI